jgi:hypothetical protein
VAVPPPTPAPPFAAVAVPPPPAPSRLLTVTGMEAVSVARGEVLVKAEALGLGETVAARVRVSVERGEEEGVARSVECAVSLSEGLVVEEVLEEKEGEEELVREAPPAGGLPVEAEEALAVAPPGSEGVWVELSEGVQEGVGGKVMEGVVNGEPEVVMVGTGVTRAEGEAVGVGEDDGGALVGLPARESDGDAEARPEKEVEGVDERERERVRLEVIEGVRVGSAVGLVVPVLQCDGLEVEQMLTETLVDNVWDKLSVEKDDEDKDRLLVPLRLLLTVALCVEDTETVPVPKGVMVALMEGELEWVGKWLPLSVPLTDFVPLLQWLTLSVLVVAADTVLL